MKRCAWCGKPWPDGSRYVTVMVQAPLPFLELARYRVPGDPLHLCTSVRQCRRRRAKADELERFVEVVRAVPVLLVGLELLGHELERGGRTPELRAVGAALVVAAGGS